MEDKGYKLTTVQGVPERVRRGLYREIVDDFLASGETTQLVEVDGKEMNQIMQGLLYTLRSVQTPLRVFTRVGQVYLTREV